MLEQHAFLPSLLVPVLRYSHTVRPPYYATPYYAIPPYYAVFGGQIFPPDPLRIDLDDSTVAYVMYDNDVIIGDF